jgi:flavin-dependent dehydrogenase
MPGKAEVGLMHQVLEADVAIVGGGFGGTAAAVAAAEAGLSVILSEVTGWIGGQVTSQAVSALDEHRYIETFGGTRSYYTFRESVRGHYRRMYPQARRMRRRRNR